MRYTVVEVPFKDYVKAVVVSEFGTGWDESTMRAGAVAVKQYALYQYYTGGKWGGHEQGIMYDCDWDMYYNPAWRRSDADKAVDDTWDYIMIRDGDLFPAHFLAWPNACDSYFGEGNCLSQRLSYKQGDRGMTWQEILEYAYGDIFIIKNVYAGWRFP